MVAMSIPTWTAQDLTLALGGKWNGRSGMASCPTANHKRGDKRPSLSITTGTKVPVLVCCHTGCTFKDVMEALESRGIISHDQGRLMAPTLTLDTDSGNGHHPVDDDEPAWPTVTPIARVVATYPYYDADGTLLFEKLRYEPKTFKIRDASGRWGLNGAEPVLYRLPELLAAPDAPVWLCEGEKDADNLAALGLVATTNFDGASGMWLESYAAALAGRHVIIVPDNDEPGEKHAETARAALLGSAASVRVVHLKGLPEKGDVSDWLADGGTLAQLQFLAEEAFPYRFKLRTPADIERMDPPVYLATNWLVQGTLAALYGPSGVGKSFIVLDLLYSISSGTEWLGSIPVVQGAVVYIAAEGVGGLQKRQRAWLATHPDADISSVRYITVPVNMLEAPEVNDLLDSIRGQCPDMPVLVVIDTLARSMAGGDENSTHDMNAVIAAADRVRMLLGCHVLIVHHTGKNGENERGSSALRGACDTMLKVHADNGAIMLECDKQKDAITPAAIGLKLVPVDGTDSCVLDVFDATGQVTQTARKLLRILADSFPLDEGASTTAWQQASRLAPETFYRSRKILVSNGCVVKASKFAPNMITVTGCKDLDIQPSASTPPDGTTSNYHETTTVVSEALETTTTTGASLGPRGSSSSAGWAGASE